MKKKIPCEDCLCKPICRLKLYYCLLVDCSILTDLLYKRRRIDSAYRQSNWEDSIKQIVDKLNPYYWDIIMSGTARPTIFGTNLEGINHHDQYKSTL